MREDPKAPDTPPWLQGMLLLWFLALAVGTAWLIGTGVALLWR